MSTDPNKIIYSMINVSKFYDNKPILKDISLSYFYGAKIGVLGLNGSGKSSLLRILAGEDQKFNGETILSPEPHLPSTAMAGRQLLVLRNRIKHGSHVRFEGDFR